ncbi:helix-turn-helix domain-containing protein [Gemmatimonadota bacterium]
MAPKMFGELLKELRQKQGYTLREYCRKFDQDPAYISRLERGKIAPPVKDDLLEKLARSFNFEEGSDDWKNFIRLALVSAGRIPDEIMSDEEALKHLPAFLRTLNGEKLTEEQLDTLIQVIKRA